MNKAGRDQIKTSLRVKKEYKYTKCIVVFLDILGFKKMV